MSQRDVPVDGFAEDSPKLLRDVHPLVGRDAREPCAVRVLVPSPRDRGNLQSRPNDEPRAQTRANH